MKKVYSRPGKAAGKLIQVEMVFVETQSQLPPAQTPEKDNTLTEAEIDRPLSHDDAFGAFLAKIPSRPKISHEEEIRLLKICQDDLEGNEKALETLVMDNQKLVICMAKRYSRYGCPIEDLVSEANLGLLEAIRKFDPSKGNRLGTYAVWWIKQYLRKALTENCRTIRIPICQQQTVRKIHATAAKLSELTGCFPSDEEIADEAGLDPAKVTRLRNLTVPMVSLQTPVGDHSSRETRTYEDIISDQTGAGESPLEALGKKNGGETLKILIRRRLNKTEQNVVSLRFGLDGAENTGTGKTLEEIGDLLGLTRERIRQIQNQALAKLRRSLMAEKNQQPTLLSILPFNKPGFAG